jgi:hypothetical protein
MPAARRTSWHSGDPRWLEAGPSIDPSPFKKREHRAQRSMDHVVGSWRVGALPGNYGTDEWQTIASLLRIQTAAVSGFMYFLHK